MPVIPANWEAEAIESPEPRRRRLQWAEIAPLHSSLGNKSKTLSQKKREREREKKEGKEKNVVGTFKNILQVSTGISWLKIMFFWVA